MKLKKILISGGWGYHNLGDDAILKSTLNLVNHFFPKRDKIVTSYDPNQSIKIVEDENINCIQSVPRIIFGKYWHLSFINENVHVTNIYKIHRFFKKVRNRIWLLFIRFFPSLFLFFLRIFYNKIYKDFSQVDLFIMSGGGYFASGDISLISRFIEIEVAKLYRAKVVLVGQSIGPFTRNIDKKIVKRCLLKCDVIQVRDWDSLHELQAMGIKVEKDIIPDLALYDNIVMPKKQLITLIPFSRRILVNMSKICNILHNFQKTENYKIRITISQQWKIQNKIAYELYQMLQSMSCDVEFVIPSDVDELQTGLGESQIVISENLHGLIMAYRAGSSIISLNDTRKFKTFMEITQKKDLLIGLKEFDEHKLITAINKCINEREHNDKIKKEISAEIESKINNIFHSLKLM